MSGRVLDVRDLRVTLPGVGGPVAAVRGLSFSLEAGRSLAIVGESGYGKTTVCLAAMGLLPPGAEVSGSIKLDGQELLGLSEAELASIRGNKLAMVFQDSLSALTPVYSVGDQIAEAITAHSSLSKAKARAAAVELLDLVGLAEPKKQARAFPHQLSGGMRQRALIAMAIANDPLVIIADEPTTALDVTTQAQILDVLARVQCETGAGIVLVTHDLGVVAAMADQMVVMYAGIGVEVGAVAEVFENPKMPYTVGLLNSVPRLDRPRGAKLAVVGGDPASMTEILPGCPFEPRCPMAEPRCATHPPELAPVGPGTHRAACWRWAELPTAELFAAPQPLWPTPARIQPRPVVLAVQGLERHFPLWKGAVLRRRVGITKAVNGIDLELRQGETLGLVGESGCGKTTTVMEILNLTKPVVGTVHVLGQDTAAITTAQRKVLRGDLQMVFQDPLSCLDPRMQIFDIIAEPLRVNGFARAKVAGRVAELLALVGLTSEHAYRYPRHLSSGQRQRIGIARALAVEPKVLVLDEPVSALDVSLRSGVLNLLKQLQAELGLAYLFISHDLAVIGQVADRVAVMLAGRIVESGAVADLWHDAAHPYTEALLSAVPIPDPAVERNRSRIVLPVERPHWDPEQGCGFRGRCFRYEALPFIDRTTCDSIVPDLVEYLAGRQVACHFPADQSVRTPSA